MRANRESNECATLERALKSPIVWSTIAGILPLGLIFKYHSLCAAYARRSGRPRLMPIAQWQYLLDQICGSLDIWLTTGSGCPNM
jgi:hypothetical protein